MTTPDSKLAAEALRFRWAHGPSLIPENDDARKQMASALESGAKVIVSKALLDAYEAVANAVVSVCSAPRIGGSDATDSFAFAMVAQRYGKTEATRRIHAVRQALAQLEAARKVP